VTALQRRGERLGDQVGGRLAVAGLPRAPGQQPRRVPAVERRERRRVGVGEREQLFITCTCTDPTTL
jgi:hypothetical protein